MTQQEVKQRSSWPLEGISKKVEQELETETDTWLVYWVNFDLFAKKQTPKTKLIWVLLDRILIHDPTTAVKTYTSNIVGNDIAPGDSITDVCWIQQKLKMYFVDVWTTEHKARFNNGTYRLNRKMWLETKLEFKEIKARMGRWLEQEKSTCRNHTSKSRRRWNCVPWQFHSTMA